VSTQEETNWIFTFGLTERCLYSSIESSSSIELMTESDENQKTRYVTGFSISIKASSDEEARNKAERQAKVLTDIMSIKRERYVGYYILGHSMLLSDRPEKTYRVSKELIQRWNILKNLEIDLKENKIASAVKNDLPQNLQFHHASLGLRAAQFELYDIMIRELYQAIELDKSMLRNECAKYEPVRHALSHPGELQADTRQALEKSFGKDYYEFTKRNQHDPTSPKNRDHLRAVANDLRRIVIDHLSKKL
jgi:hypothetical protein